MISSKHVLTSKTKDRDQVWEKALRRLRKRAVVGRGRRSSSSTWEVAQATFYRHYDHSMKLKCEGNYLTYFNFKDWAIPAPCFSPVFQPATPCVRLVRPFPFWQHHLQLHLHLHLHLPFLFLLHLYPLLHNPPSAM